MRPELSIIEKIELYLTNQLPAEERIKFEAKINQDQQLKTEVEIQRAIMQGAQRVALRKSIQTGNKAFIMQEILKKLVVVIIGIAIVWGLIKFIDKVNIIQQEKPEEIILFPYNDSLSTEANSYLEQQIFNISTVRDTVIETVNGITIYIPKEAFNTSEEAVQLLVQEALNPEDIIMAGLSTETDSGKELETGGMFYIDAYASGQRISLKQNLLVDIPTHERKANMQLYDGKKNQNGEVVWSNPTALETFLTPVEITELDFYPPGYESKLAEMGNTDKEFKDSLYYSFACIEGEGDNFLKGKGIYEQYCAACHMPNDVLIGPSLVGSKERWMKNSSEKNFYAFVRNSFSVIEAGDPYAKELFAKYNRVLMPPNNLTDTEIDQLYSYIENKNHTDMLGEGNNDTTYSSSCEGVNPASVNVIWDSKFNNTNLATKQFEERMPWIHRSCNNEVLELYINNLEKRLSTVDSMTLKYLNGEVLEKFRYFASRNDGRVETNNIAASKLGAYYRKKQKAVSRALFETQKKFWAEQEQLDAVNQRQREKSVERTLKSQFETFSKEYQKNYCKVVTELQLGVDCRFSNQRIPLTYTAQVSTLGWKNIDREVLEATSQRKTTSVSRNGRTSIISYSQWTATIENFSKYDRIFVYNIPIEFDTYIKLKGREGTYTYNLNADLKYQTVIIGWSSGNVYFYNANTTAGADKISLKKASSKAVREKIKKNLKSNIGMQNEIDFRFYFEKDRKRMASNEEKRRIRRGVESIVFPCIAPEESGEIVEIFSEGLSQ